MSSRTTTGVRDQQSQDHCLSNIILWRKEFNVRVKCANFCLRKQQNKGSEEGLGSMIFPFVSLACNAEKERNYIKQVTKTMVFPTKCPSLSEALWISEFVSLLDVQKSWFPVMQPLDTAPGNQNHVFSCEMISLSPQPFFRIHLKLFFMFPSLHKTSPTFIPNKKKVVIQSASIPKYTI